MADRRLGRPAGGDGSLRRRSTRRVAVGRPSLSRGFLVAVGLLRVPSERKEKAVSSCWQMPSGGLGGAYPRHDACPTRVLTRTDLDKSPGQKPKNVVEVAGIEPASFGFSPGILRAQPLIFVGRRLANGTGRRPYLAKSSLAAG